MATADVIELEPLLSPIPGDTPTGVDLRADSSATSDYIKLKDARFAARAKEREIDGDPSLASGELPEWRTILDLAPKLLATQTKDLEIGGLDARSAAAPPRVPWSARWFSIDPRLGREILGWALSGAG